MQTYNFWKTKADTQWLKASPFLMMLNSSAKKKNTQIEFIIEVNITHERIAVCCYEKETYNIKTSM